VERTINSGVLRKCLYTSCDARVTSRGVMGHARYRRRAGFMVWGVYHRLLTAETCRVTGQSTLTWNSIWFVLVPEDIFSPSTFVVGAHGGVVVKTLRYKLARRGFDSR
jgi:hypothetical protein